MTIVGFSFTKMIVERKASVKGKINIANNISIKEVKESQIALGKGKETAIKLTFDFSSKYNPNVGIINLIGEVLNIEDEKKTKDILKEWKKSKKLPQEIMTPILNHILNKCNIQSLILSKDLNLPPPIPMPRINPTEGKEKQYIG
ncbi:MAG: hypothetical protein QF632_00920 [Candidatus Woesearchaeota archaeon]|jgi:hypothetical protein|nr:hypothetical protein [Candidatus Woesearchaeota archaeon]MDP7323303.1 hypothetical protein [Candidatus Woesearchaeota archaeon]MDP7457666.1 hypothetical protein [Candidatus Woesearchaeota archaeon]